MANFVNKLQANSVCKLSGKISNYQCVRKSASFVYSKGDQEKFGVVAVAAALAGMGGQATAVTASASVLEEEADYVQFCLNGDTVKGWVWRSPFKEGDLVDVAAEWRGSHYEAYGIARPADRMIALYPHCSRSRIQHIKNAVKWWFICNLLFYFFMVALALSIGIVEMFYRPEFYKIYGPLVLFFIIMFVSLAGKYMPFVRLSEKVFKILGFPNVKSIDLVKSSKLQRTADDPGEFGTFYFRY